MISSAVAITVGGERLGSGLIGSNYMSPSALQSEYPSPRVSARQGNNSSLMQDDLKHTKMSEKDYIIHHIKIDLNTFKKKVEYLQQLFNRQTDYFDSQMHKSSVKFESMANLEKRLQIHIQ